MKYKFKGKRKDTGERIKGSLFIHGDKFYILTAEANVYLSEDMDNPAYDYGENIIMYGIYEVVPETVGQWTGLIAKNGEEIYEGDIVKWFNYNTATTYRRVVNYQQGGFFCGEYYLYAILIYSPVVIGNIHDNPDLLKGGNHND